MVGGDKIATRMMVVMRLVLIFLCAFFLPRLFIKDGTGRIPETERVTSPAAETSFRCMTKKNYSRLIHHLVAFLRRVRNSVQVDPPVDEKIIKGLLT